MRQKVHRAMFFTDDGQPPVRVIFQKSCCSVGGAIREEHAGHCSGVECSVSTQQRELRSLA
jgi:hypothetical protein